MLRAACQRVAHVQFSRRWATVALNGVASPSALTTGEFLTQRDGPGVYTTARTCAGGQRLFEWNMHVQRTAASAAAVLKAAVPADEVASGEVSEDAVVVDPDKLSLLRHVLGTVDGLRPLLDTSVAVAVDHFKREAAAAEGQKLGSCATAGAELRIAVSVGFDTKSGEPIIAAHVDAMPPPPPRPVRIEVRGAPRQDAGIKSSAWIKQRKPLEELLRAADVGPGGINELVLSSSVPGTEAKEIYEGAQTNFFAIINGAVHTAPLGTVLAGTVRRLVLEVCEAEDIKVVLEPPVLETDETPAECRWEGAMISSTSRLLLPVDEVYLPKPGKPSTGDDFLRSFDNDAPGALAPRLAQLVQEAIVTNSEPIPRPPKRKVPKGVNPCTYNPPGSAGRQH